MSPSSGSRPAGHGDGAGRADVPLPPALVEASAARAAWLALGAAIALPVLHAVRVLAHGGAGVSPGAEVVTRLVLLGTVLCCLALFVLRRTHPGLARPFRAWGYPWSAAVVLIGAAAFLVGAAIGDPINAAAAVVLVAAGFVIRVIV